MARKKEDFERSREDAERRPKPLRLLTGMPEMSGQAARDTQRLLLQLQEGGELPANRSKPMKTVGPRCQELRVWDGNRHWRLFCRIDRDVILIIHAFSKKTQKTPDHEIEIGRKRLAIYDAQD